MSLFDFLVLSFLLLLWVTGAQLRLLLLIVSFFMFVIGYHVTSLSNILMCIFWIKKLSVLRVGLVHKVIVSKICSKYSATYPCVK